MSFNIQFQVSSLVFIFVIIILYLAKPKIHNTQNKIFFYQLILSFLLVSCDIISCIFLALKDEFPAWNDVFGKGYIILMLLWLASIVDYLVATISHDKMSYKVYRFLGFFKWIVYGISLVLIIVTLCFPVYYFHQDRVVYSYGVPSTCTYIFSFLLCIVLITLVLSNWKFLIARKKIPCLAFVLASAIPALIQSLLPENLLLSLGCGVTELIMYMALENPDLEYANRIDALNYEKLDLFQNIVPEYISEKMKYKLSSFYEEENDICVAYIKIRNFSEIVESKGLEKTVSIVNKIYQAVDSILDNYGIEKVKISGDTYEVAIGLNGSDDTDCQNMISFINAVRTIISGISLGNEIEIKASYGVGFGPVAVCMMGKKRLSFDLLSSAAEHAFYVSVNCEADNVLVTEEVKKRAGDVFCFELKNPELENNPEFEKLYYLR